MIVFTSTPHYVLVPSAHIVIDFDIKDETEKKSKGLKFIFDKKEVHIERLNDNFKEG